MVLRCFNIGRDVVQTPRNFPNQPTTLTWMSVRSRRSRVFEQRWCQGFTQLRLFLPNIKMLSGKSLSIKKSNALSHTSCFLLMLWGPIVGLRPPGPSLSGGILCLWYFVFLAQAASSRACWARRRGRPTTPRSCPITFPGSSLGGLLAPRFRQRWLSLRGLSERGYKQFW